MLIVCNGMPKSASTFAFQLTRGVANTRWDQQTLLQRVPETHRAVFHPNISRAFPVLVSVPAQDEALVVKTHGLVSNAIVKGVTAGHADVVMTIRDPLEIAGSLMDAGAIERRKPAAEQRLYFAEIVDPRQALAKAANIAKSAGDWLYRLRYRPPLVLPFRLLKHAPHRAVQLIAQRLGLPDVDVDPILGPLLENKQERIVEYNKGGERDLSELRASPRPPEVSRAFDTFRTQMLNPVEARLGLERVTRD